MEPPAAGPGDDPKVHVFVLETDTPRVLEECLSSLKGDRSDAIHVDVVDRVHLEDVLGRSSNGTRRIAILPMDGGPRRNGDLLGQLKSRWPGVPVLVVSGG